MTSLSRRARSLPLFLVAACVLFAGCAETQAWRNEPQPWSNETFRRVQAVRVHRADGAVDTVRFPEIAKDDAGPFLYGATGPHGERDHPGTKVHLSQVQSIEALRYDADRLNLRASEAVTVVYPVAVVYLIVPLAFGLF